MSATALRIEGLALRGGRRLRPTALRPGPVSNVVHGDSGAGKSNVLEALA